MLRDLLAAGAIPRVRLTRIFRQAQQSGIVVNAHRINHGQPPQLTGFGDFYWFACEPPEDSGLHPAEETARLVVDIVARRVPARFGLDPVRDVQVLCPTTIVDAYRHASAVANANARAERQRAMRRCNCRAIQTLAIRCAMTAKTITSAIDARNFGMCNAINRKQQRGRTDQSKAI